MTTLQLSDGRALPVPGFGTWRCDPATLQPAIVAAIRAGFRHIDTGPYRNEALVGAGIREALSLGLIASRADLFITGKLPATCMDPAAVEPALRKLLAELGTDYVDLYITHWPYALAPDSTASPPLPAARRGYSAEAYLATWRAMEACVDAGLARALGCSNMTAAKLAALLPAARVRPVAVQNELHTALAQPDLLRFAAAAGITLCGYCPLGSPGRPDLYRAPGDPEVLGHPEVAAVAAAAGRTPAQVLLRWAIQRGTAPLPRSTNPARIVENFGVHGWALPPALMARLDALDRTKGSEGRIMKVRAPAQGSGVLPGFLYPPSPTSLIARAHTAPPPLPRSPLQGDNFAPPSYADWRQVWDEDFTF